MNREEQLKETILSKATVYSGPIFDVEHEDIITAQQVPSKRTVIRHPGAVCVIPLLKNGDVLMEYQWRCGCEQVLLEIPAGKLNSKDEDPLEAALRELQEETGAIPGKMTSLGTYYGSPAILDEHIEMYLAEDLSFGKTHFDEDEVLQVEKIPLTKLVEMVLAEEIPDGKTQVAILKTYMILKERDSI